MLSIFSATVDVERVALLADDEGRFHSGFVAVPAAVDVTDRETAIDAAAAFLVAYAPDLDIDAERVDHLVFTDFHETENGRSVITAEAVIQGLRVADADMTVVFGADGTTVDAVHSVALMLLDSNGAAAADAEIGDGLALDEAIAACTAGFPEHDPTIAAIVDASWTESATSAGTPTWSAMGPLTGKSQIVNTATIERVWNAQTLGVEWRMRTPRWEVALDEASGELRAPTSLVRGDGSGLASFLVQKFEGQGVEADNFSAVGNDGTETRTDTTDWLSMPLTTDRKWILRRAYSDWAILHVLDMNSSEVEDITTSSGSPSFNYTVTSSFGRQTSAYHWVKRARNWWRTEVFGTIATQSWDDLRIEIDHDTTACSGAPSLCYFPGSRTIAVEVGTPELKIPGAYQHEFGHYVTSMYGGLNYVCSPGSNESAAIDEAISTVAAQIVLRSPDTFGSDDADPSSRNAVYGTNLAEYVSRVTEHAHTDGGGASQTKPATCGSAHQFGDFWTQAMWEVLNNIDCNGAVVCVDFDDYQAGQNNISIWGTSVGWSNATAASVGLGRAAATALKAVPLNTTFAAFAIEMKQALTDSHGSTVASAFDSILFHHGLDI